MLNFQNLKFPLFDKTLTDEDHYIVEFTSDDKQIYIVRTGYLTTRSPSLPKMAFKILTEKELFDKDYELLETISPEFSDSTSLVKKIINVDLFPKDPLVLFIVKQENIADRFLHFSRSTEVYIKITNQEKLKSFFEEKANAYPFESLFILYPFEKIKSKYISISWEDFGLILVFSRLEDDEERKELDCFLCFFKRYLKWTCDVDMIQILEI
jgi:hypothetical protein